MGVPIEHKHHEESAPNLIPAELWQARFRRPSAPARGFHFANTSVQWCDKRVIRIERIHEMRLKYEFRLGQRMAA